MNFVAVPSIQFVHYISMWFKALGEFTGFINTHYLAFLLLLMGMVVAIIILDWIAQVLQCIKKNFFKFF